MWKSAGDDEPGPQSQPLWLLSNSCKAAGPEGAFGQARRNILDKASVRGTTPCWISERADARHPPPRESYTAKQFNPEKVLRSRAAALENPWVPSPVAVRLARSRTKYELSKLALALPMALFAYHGSEWALLPRCSGVILRQVSGFAASDASSAALPS